MLRYPCTFFLALIFSGCSKKNNAACTQPLITVDNRAAAPCTNSGSLKIVTPAGAGITYRINGGSYQSAVIFSSLQPGAYTLYIKENSVCEYNVSVTVPETPSGPLFTAVKSLLATHCVSCHGGNNPQAGFDWSRSCDILNFWDRIKARAVDASPSPMPQGGLLPLAERNKITDWINAGHRYSD